MAAICEHMDSEILSLVACGAGRQSVYYVHECVDVGVDKSELVAADDADFLLVSIPLDSFGEIRRRS